MTAPSKIDKTFFFMAGLPRSGSTVLASILNQNPALYTTPTSPLLDLLLPNEQEWHKNPSVVANKFPQQLPNMSTAIINGCWAHVPQQIIIDKHRAWGRNLPAISQIFGVRPKLLVTVRDIPSVVASFMRLLRESKQRPHFIDRDLAARNIPLTDENRAVMLWENYIFDTWDSFRTAWELAPDSLLLVDYDDLIARKSETIARVYDFLGLPHFEHDFENIRSTTVDDDLLAWGIENLHTIRPSLAKTCATPEEILGTHIFTQFKNTQLEFWRRP